MTTKAAIVGWAHSPFGKLDAPDVESLFSLVGTAALDHAGVAPGDVEFAAVGVLNSGFSKQGFEAGLVGTRCRAWNTCRPSVPRTPARPARPPSIRRSTSSRAAADGSPSCWGPRR